MERGSDLNRKISLRPYSKNTLITVCINNLNTSLQSKTTIKLHKREGDRSSMDAIIRNADKDYHSLALSSFSFSLESTHKNRMVHRVCKSLVDRCNRRGNKVKASVSLTRKQSPRWRGKSLLGEEVKAEIQSIAWKLSRVIASAHAEIANHRHGREEEDSEFDGREDVLREVRLRHWHS
eukprot:TRINITY_DN18798_c0_g1_i1.p3 TRINITY_DN18798_c0_g1~~TRINITY_DN18798_c0_g1_i1.p3  ORF type:complete len:179 (-),score=29.98 TRINITY_DN18798_c0_g1_i1:550-1086(-)